MKSTLSYGLATGLTMGLIDGLNIYYFYDLPIGRYASYINMGVLVVGIIAGIRHVAISKFDREIPYPQASFSGIRISIYAGIVYGFLSFLIFNFANQDFMTLYFDTYYRSLLEQGATSEEAETLINEQKIGFTPFRIALSSLISTFIFGLFTSLVSGYVIKRTMKKTA
jgi:hypothetical protein